MKKIGLLLGCMSLFLLFGCGTKPIVEKQTGEIEQTVEKKRDYMGETSFITGLDAKANRALIGQIQFDIDENSTIENDVGDQLTYADLELGMKVNVTYDYVLEPFPGQGTAKSIVVITDRASKKEQEIVNAVLDHLGEGTIVIWTVQYIEVDKAYEVDVTVLSQTESGRIVYTIDEKTNKISNESRKN